MAALNANVLPSILVTLSFAIPSAIFTEAFCRLSAWALCHPRHRGAPCVTMVYPASLPMHTYPALFISLAVLAFNLLGDGLRDALDVQARERKGSTT